MFVVCICIFLLGKTEHNDQELLMFLTQNFIFNTIGKYIVSYFSGVRCDSGTSLYTLGFPNRGKRWGEIPPHPVGMQLEILLSGSFLLGEGNLRRSDFDNFNLFQSEKQLSVNTEHQLKPKLT